MAAGKFVPDEAGFRAFEGSVGDFERKVAGAIAQSARERVAVLSGATRDSIHVVELDRHVAVVAGSAAVFLELGTGRMRPEPFLWPAVREAARSISAIARGDITPPTDFGVRRARTRRFTAARSTLRARRSRRRR